jgi:hypothetical protein
MISEFFRKLFGIRNYEEDFQAGVQYAQDQLKRHRNNLLEYHRLWAECDSGGADPSGFDAGMRQVLGMQNIPHPLDPPEKNNAAFHDCLCGRKA